MYHRIFDIVNRLDEGMFLFGGRQVGKSTLLRERFPDAIYVDLLDPDTRKRFERRTMEFYEMLVKYPPNWVGALMKSICIRLFMPRFRIMILTGQFRTV